ncbi:MAG: hypothetical protein VB049_07380 [Candidatus Pelethousia sp.]|nr:hypothetical protein [Candidatus Pelethousia sp.]
MYEEVIFQTIIRGATAISADVRIRPVELGFNHINKAVKGLPYAANAEVTQEIFDTLAVLRSQYGTELKMEEAIIEVVL